MKLAVISCLHLLEVAGLFDTWPLIKLPQIIDQIGITLDPLKVAFEMAVVNEIETEQGWERPPVGFGDSRAREVPSFG